MMKKMRPLLPFVLNYRRSIFVLGMLLVVASVLEGVGIGLFFPLLDYIQKGDAFLSGRTAQAFFSALAWVGVPPSAGFLVACIFLVITLTALLKLAGKMLAARVYNPIMQDVRQEAFRRIVGSHLSYFHAGSSARLTQTIEFEADLVGIGLSMVADLMSGSLSLLVYVALLCILSWKLTLVVAVLAALRYGAASLFLHETLRLGTEHAGLRTRLKAYLLAVHQGIDVIKTCGMEKREEENFRGLTSRVKENKRPGRYHRQSVLLRELRRRRSFLRIRVPGHSPAACLRDRAPHVPRGREPRHTQDLSVQQRPHLPRRVHREDQRAARGAL